MRLKHLDILCRKAFLADLPDGKLLINTINAFSYVNARKDALFAEALKNSDILIPDGISIVKVCRFIGAESQPAERIAGWDLFVYEMERTNRKGGKVMFLGSSDNVLELIRKRVGVEYPNICVDTFSPPYKDCFDKEDDEKMINAVNQSNPDLLWIGMTAPKQEKWAYTHIDRLEVNCHIGTIGAVFDFFAGTVKRAPEAWQRAGLEWLYRLVKEPRRMWRRYLLGNVQFLLYMLEEKIKV